MCFDFFFNSIFYFYFENFWFYTFQKYFFPSIDNLFCCTKKGYLNDHLKNLIIGLLFFPLLFNCTLSKWSCTWTFLESSSSWFLWNFLFSQIKIEKISERKSGQCELLYEIGWISLCLDCIVRGLYKMIMSFQVSVNFESFYIYNNIGGMGKGLNNCDMTCYVFSHNLASHFGEILGRERLHGKYYKFPLL